MNTNMIKKRRKINIVLQTMKDGDDDDDDDDDKNVAKSVTCLMHMGCTTDKLQNKPQDYCVKKIAS
jgi:hypothetical protein